MTLSLPEPIAAYFSADALGGDLVAQCFTSDGIVIDEKREHQGREAIARWKTDASERYRYVAEPRAIAVEGGERIVTAHLTGQFTGSPIDLRYAFTLADGKIAKLEITA